MRYRPLGDSGLVVSRRRDRLQRLRQPASAPTRCEEVVDAALDAGVTLFDTADTYGFGASEELLGAALRGTPRRRRGRHQVRHGHGGQERSRPRRPGLTPLRPTSRRGVACAGCGTDHIDLYQLHQPDLVTPVEETLAALNELVAEGKVRYLGCSNFAAWEVTEAQLGGSRAAASSGFVTAQNEYSLYNRVAEDELVPACLDAGVGLLPYFPLAYGLLTGKYAAGVVPRRAAASAHESQRGRLEGADFSRVEALQEYAAAREVDLLSVAVGGLAAQPAVGVGDRRCEPRRAGAGQRRRRGVGAHR